MASSPAATLARGIAALSVLAGIVVGVPIWLELVAGSPIPETLPSLNQVWADLTSRDDGTLLLGLLKYAAWAGWALFLISVLGDLASRARGLPTPRLGPQQKFASSLVGAVVAIAISVPAAGVATAAPQPPTAVTLADESPRTTWVSALATPPTAEVNAKVGVKASKSDRYEEYQVRRGDCLWDIAWNELGEPERWPEIYQASRGIEQEGGRKLTDPDLILTGWVLHIPKPEVKKPRAEVTPEPSESSPATPAPVVPLPPEPTLETPFSGPAATVFGQSGVSSAEQGQRVRGLPSLSGTAGDLRVVTPLRGSSAGSAAEASAVESHWLGALEQRGAGGRDWRSALTDPHRG